MNYKDKVDEYFKKYPKITNTDPDPSTVELLEKLNAEIKFLQRAPKNKILGNKPKKPKKYSCARCEIKQRTNKKCYGCGGKMVVDLSVKTTLGFLEKTKEETERV